MVLFLPVHIYPVSFLYVRHAGQTVLHELQRKEPKACFPIWFNAISEDCSNFLFLLHKIISLDARAELDLLGIGRETIALDELAVAHFQHQQALQNVVCSAFCPVR